MQGRTPRPSTAEIGSIQMRREYDCVVLMYACADLLAFTHCKIAISLEKLCSVRDDRGRDTTYVVPPAQTRTGAR
jgi:hypothetical protein